MLSMLTQPHRVEQQPPTASLPARDEEGVSVRSTVLVFLSVAATMIFAVGADAPAQEEEGDCPPYVICIDDPPPTSDPQFEDSGPQWTTRCEGGFCAGSSGKDVIRGSKVADQIHARAGADSTRAGAGNDEVHGGGGRVSDTLWSGGGDDALWGG